MTAQVIHVDARRTIAEFMNQVVGLEYDLREDEQKTLETILFF